MPTPTTAFVKIASRLSGVNPGDAEAVQNWYLKILPTLSREQLEEILEELLEQQAASTEGAMSPVYPRDVPLPYLATAWPVPLPPLAEGVIAMLVRMLMRNSPSGFRQE